MTSESDNPYAKALGAVHEPEEPQPSVDETAEVVHLKVPGGSLACGAMPHGITATMDAKKATCQPCLDAHRVALSTPC